MRALVLILALTAVATSTLAAKGIVDSKHNLSISGPGPFKSESEDQICIFCHTPHQASVEAPLWNRSSEGAAGVVASIEDSIIGSSNSTVLCLSCHDGTIALGDLKNAGSGKSKGADALSKTFLTGRSSLGTDLSNDHPVAIAYQPDRSAPISRLKRNTRMNLPLENNMLQCGTCHDPHDDAIPPFLHRSTQNGELCTSCHEFDGADWDWESSSHALSIAEPVGKDPWPDRKPEWKGKNVAENACMNCHAPHNATTPQSLVNDAEENTCYRCHDGTFGSGNLRFEGSKFFRHPVEVTPNRGHRAGVDEDPLRMVLHVECEDCHNPHATREDDPMISFNPSSPLDAGHTRAPFVNGRIRGVSGIDINGTVKDEAEFQYEVCFKCHGVPGKSACDRNRCSTARNYDMSRQDQTYNIRNKVDPGNPSLVSYHPIDTNNPANNLEVPSLSSSVPLNRWTSLIYCTDCHAGSSSPAAGGNQPSGPHGSNYEAILALDYDFSPETGFNARSAQLCFKCHDSGSLFSNQSFLHKEHVLDYGSSCINCHDPHGSAVYPHLLNFLVRANVSGTRYRIDGTGPFPAPTWLDGGTNAGTCWLNCHGVEHNGLQYPVLTTERPPAPGFN